MRLFSCVFILLGFGLSGCSLGFNSSNCFIDNQSDNPIDSVKLYINQKWILVDNVAPKSMGKEKVEIDYFRLKDYTSCGGMIYVNGRNIPIPIWFLNHGGDYKEAHVKLDSLLNASAWLE
jgi:hypothetical protein